MLRPTGFYCHYWVCDACGAAAAIERNHGDLCGQCGHEGAYTVRVGRVVQKPQGGLFGWLLPTKLEIEWREEKPTRDHVRESIQRNKKLAELMSEWDTADGNASAQGVE